MGICRVAVNNTSRYGKGNSLHTINSLTKEVRMEKQRMRHTKKTGGRRDARAKMMSRFALAICLLCMLVAVMPLSAAADEAGKDTGWQFGADIYGWAPGFGIKTTGGENLDVDFDDVIKALKFTAQGGVSVRKGRWSLSTDVIYMALKQDSNKSVTATVGPRGHEINIDADVTVRLTGWIVTPFVGYTFYDNGKLRTDAIAGVRYLWLKPDLELDVEGPLKPRHNRISDSGDVWDGIVGIRGDLNLDKNWYVPYYADMGTGDSTFTWQALIGAGYRISKAMDVVAAYRYLYWNFDDNKVLDSLDAIGMLIGLRFRF